MVEKIEELKALTSDEDKLKFLQDNNEFFVYLDNDAASISLFIDYDNWPDDKIFKYEDYNDSFWSSFDKDFGNRDGVYNLFKMLGIEAQPV